MLSALVVLVIVGGASLAMNEPPAVSVTIYSAADPRGFDPQQFAAQQRLGADPMFAWQVPGFGIVREIRTILLQAGRNDVPFADVAAFIDPTTVSFADLTDPSTVVLEQNFQFDLVSPSKLYERYIGEKITLEPRESPEKVIGTLLSANQSQFVVQTDRGVRVVPQAETQVLLGELPGGLITKPTLVWRLDAKTGGEHRIRTSYQTAGMTWRADYNLVLASDETKANITPWVTLMNVSGVGFRDAQLRLVAGDVQRVQPEQRFRRPGRGGPEMAMAADAGFTEEQLFEYHLYTLPRATDILANTSMQLTLFPPVAEVPVKKELVYVGAPQFQGFAGPRLVDQDLGVGMNRKVSVFLSFKNDEASRLGMPLPKGRVRAYKQSADGTIEFIGEDVIDHTPRNGDIRLKLGESFDVTGERVQTDFRIDNGRREMFEAFRITLRNGRRNPEKVQVREFLYRWTNWELVSESTPSTKVDARTITWDVEVPAEGSATIEYRVRYTW